MIKVLKMVVEMMMKKNNFTPHGIYFVCTCVCERTEVCVKGQKYVWAEYAIYIKSFFKLRFLIKLILFSTIMIFLLPLTHCYTHFNSLDLGCRTPKLYTLVRTFEHAVSPPNSTLTLFRPLTILFRRIF